MTDHDPLDPLCPWRPDPKYPDHNHCQCPLLTQARADERERIARAIEAVISGDDERLLLGEARRAYARLALIRDTLDSYWEHELLFPEVYRALHAMTRIESDNG